MILVFSFWAPVRFLPASLWIWERIRRQRLGGNPWEGLFFSHFWERMRGQSSEGLPRQDWMRGALPAFPLPAWRAPARDGKAGAPRGALLPVKHGQEALAPILGTGW